MGKPKAFHKIVSDDQTLHRVQEILRSVLTAISSCEILNGVLHRNVQLSTVATKVPHKLGRKPQGYIIVNQDTGAVIYSPSAADDKFIELQATMSVRTAIWIF